MVEYNCNEFAAGSEYILVGSEFSVYTAKVRAYLKWKGVPYKEMLASDIVWKNIIQNIAKANQIPVLLIPHKSEKIGYLVIQDSKDIIDYLENAHLPLQSQGIGLAVHPLIPPTPKRAFASMMFEFLADEWLVLQAMYWRWGPGVYERQEKFLAFDFGNVSSGGIESYEKTLALGAKRGSKFKAICALLGITTTTSPVLEEQFHQLLGLMSSHFAKYPFLLGNEISLADIAFIGCFYGHLGRDPVPSYIVKTKAPLVFNWVERVMCHSQWASKNNFQFTQDWKSLVATYGTPKRGANPPEVGEDDVPESSLEIAKSLLEDFMPVLADTLKQMADYISKNTEMETALLKLPRTIGTHLFRLHIDGVEVQEERAVQTHAVWMFQRIIDRTYQTVEQRQTADGLLEAVGGHDLVEAWRQCVDEWQNVGWKVGRSRHTLIAKKSRAKAKL